MVGGKIRGVYVYTDRINVVVIDSKQYVGVDIVKTDLPLAVGDSLWWQSNKAYWTPQNKRRQDVEIERIGYSRSMGYAPMSSA